MAEGIVHDESIDGSRALRFSFDTSAASKDT
jgi:hypothetical protein